jgi:hypothetical protein
MENLKDVKVAILVENGFEQVELVEPRRALDQAGAQTQIRDSISSPALWDICCTKEFCSLALPRCVKAPETFRQAT